VATLPAVRAARVVHPFPTLLNVAATVGIAFAAADGPPPVATTIGMALAMLLAQCSIGVANDYFDRELDATAKPWKPVASGLIAPRVALAIAGACAIGALATALLLGLASTVLVALGMGCGLAYDAGLKRTPFSPIPFMVALPVLPIWVYVTLGAWEAVLWWLLPLGALLGLSIHIANTLPDIESDVANGVRGLPHRLGVRPSMFLSWGAFAAALALAVAIAPLIQPDLRWYVGSLAVGAGCLIGTIRAFVVRGEFALQLNFAAISAGAAVAAAGWLVAVT
jgi:4-hydroxybenzoate polyprenyltransferase